MKVAVIGGGITGLTAAWRLSSAGHTVSLFESGDRLGGSIRTDVSGEWMAEAGPNSLQESADIAALISEVGLDAERVVAYPSAQNRFIALGGRLVALPRRPSDILTTPVLSLGTKARVLRDLFRGQVKRAADASVGAFFRDHFGTEVVDRIIQPFVSGIYAGDPEKLSTRYGFPSLWEAEATSGSLVRGIAAAMKRRAAAGQPRTPALISFRSGLKALPEALATRLPMGCAVLGAHIRRIEAGSGTRWRVLGAGPFGVVELGVDAVVLAVTAPALAGMEIGAEGRRPLSSLSQIGHPPVVSLFLGYRREQVGHPLDGFGALIPATEKRSLLGVIFSSSLFKGRAPAGHVALTALAGGVLQPGLAGLPEDRLLDLAERDLADLLGVKGKPVFQRRSFWPSAIPQYNLGYERHLECMAAFEGAHPGLFIAGNARDGISVVNCVKSGTTVAKRVS